MRITVYGKASPAGSKTAGISKSGKMFVRDSSKGSYEWKKNVAREAAVAMGGAPLLTEALELSLTFYVPRPKGHYGSGKNASVIKASAPAHPTSKPDVLKLARAVEDGMTGIAYRDDAQIVSENIRKVYGEPSRVEIEVKEIGEPEHPFPEHLG